MRAAFGRAERLKGIDWMPSLIVVFESLLESALDLAVEAVASGVDAIWIAIDSTAESNRTVFDFVKFKLRTSEKLSHFFAEDE